MENTGASVVTYVYVILMLGIFPLFYRNNYINILESKLGFFTATTLTALVVVMICTGLLVASRYEDIKKGSWKAWVRALSITDRFVILLTFAVLVSWMITPYKMEAWTGDSGKKAGVYLYLLFAIAYFMVSRCLKYDQWILLVYIIANTIVFGLAILNHFMIDPLGMYSNLVADNYWMFITTMGNINVLAGYFCVFVPVTMVLFCFCKTLQSQIIYGVFMAISFMGLISANGDAGIIGIGCAFIFIFWFTFDSWEKLKRYFIMAFLFFASARIIGILDDAYADTVKDVLATLPSFIAKSSAGLLLMAVTGVLALVFWMLQKKAVAEKSLKIVRNGIFLLLAVAVAAGFATFIYLSTAGKDINLGVWDTYLRFSDLWGSSRGFTWKRCLIIYWEDYSFLQKIFGYGPDLLGIPLHERFNEEIFAKMGAYLVDAHNEELQILGTLGIVGVVGYVGTLVTAVKRYATHAAEDPFLLAVAVGIVAYMAQGLMSSPQTFGTPLLFIAIGIGESLIRRKKLEVKE